MTPTDSRSKRIRASRKGRPSTNTRSKRNVYERPTLPAFAPGCPSSRTVAPYSPSPKHTTVATAQSGIRQHLPSFIPDTNAIEALNGQLLKAVKTKGHFPTEDAARKLLYLATQNAVPAWTRTRTWTTALLAFKIHFEDRLPD